MGEKSGTPDGNGDHERDSGDEGPLTAATSLERMVERALIDAVAATTPTARRADDEVRRAAMHRRLLQRGIPGIQRTGRQIS